jgi:hypothetical protein
MHKNEMRLDPLTDEWTVFSEARAHQPTAASVLDETAGDPEMNPFLAGKEEYAAHTLHRFERGGNGGCAWSQIARPFCKWREIPRATEMVFTTTWTGSEPMKW